MNEKALIELAKSFGRFIYFGVLGLVVVFLTSLLAGGSLNSVVLTVGGQHINVGFLIVAAVAGVAKSIDRYVHTNSNINATGITPF